VTEHLDTKRRFLDRSSIKENTNTLRDSDSLNKSMKVSKSSTHQQWLDRSEAKNIKEILGELNGKLKKCRQRYNRELQVEA
jgi:hypothetical protein